MFEVGTAGFEPATFRPPAGCATKLRHVPMGAHNYSRRTRSGSLQTRLSLVFFLVPAGHEFSHAQLNILALGCHAYHVAGYGERYTFLLSQPQNGRSGSQSFSHHSHLFLNLRGRVSKGDELPGPAVPAVAGG